MFTAHNILAMKRVIITDYMGPPVEIEEAELTGTATIECLLAEKTEELYGKLGKADGLIVYHQVSIPKAVIDELDHCKVLVRCGVGFDNVDMAEAGRRGIYVCNVPDYGTDEVADHAIARRHSRRDGQGGAGSCRSRMNL